MSKTKTLTNSLLWFIVCFYFPHLIESSIDVHLRKSTQVFCNGLCMYLLSRQLSSIIYSFSACKENTAWLFVKVHYGIKFFKHGPDIQISYVYSICKSISPSFRFSEERDAQTPAWIHSAHLPLTSSVLVAEVREAPHVAQADDGAGD